MTSSTAWMDHGRCVGQDPATWSPAGYSDSYEPQIMEAKRECGACPVVRPCLAYALERGVDESIWGGLTPRERANARRSASARRSGATRRRAHGGAPVDATPLRAALVELVGEGRPFEYVQLAAFGDEGDRLDPSTIAKLASGARVSVYPATYDRVKLVIARAEAALAERAVPA